MKVLFVSSGNKKGGISPIVYNQGESLRREFVELDYFPVAGKGIAGYLRHWWPLFKLLRKEKYDLVHAHYSLCGFLTTMAAPLRTPIVVSLMGTFRKDTAKYYLIRLLAGRRWREVIVKSARMKGQIGLPDAHIIANGVDVTKFDLPQSRHELRQELDFSSDQKVVIFVSILAPRKKLCTLSSIGRCPGPGRRSANCSLQQAARRSGEVHAGCRRADAYLFYRRVAQRHQRSDGGQLSDRLY